MANGHGGARPGSGRKRISEKYAVQVEAFHDQVVAGLDDRYAALQLLADGGYDQVSETWEPAGLVFVEMPLLDQSGEPKMDANGRPIIVRQKAFPELDPTELVCVRRVKSVAAPDRRANEYLVDRVAGRPVAAVEGEVNVNPGAELRKLFEASVAKIYGGDES